jgi:hypothetical protein
LVHPKKKKNQTKVTHYPPKKSQLPTKHSTRFLKIYLSKGVSWVPNKGPKKPNQANGEGRKEGGRGGG